MPISSKRIITYINETRSEVFFTSQQVMKALLSPPVKEKHAKREDKKKGKGSRGSQGSRGSRENEAISKVNTVLRALVDIGCLEKRKNMYVKNRRFRLTGKMAVGSTGNGILKTDDGDDVIVQKDSLGGAMNGDRAEAVLTDYRDGVYSGQIIKVLERKRDKYFVRVLQQRDKYIYFKPLDVYGDIEFCAGAAGKKPAGEFAVVRLTGNYISGKQECAVENYFSTGDRYDVERIIAKHSLPGEHRDYPELKEFRKKVPKSEFKDRKDYSKLFTITIDGERAKDFDDAISLEMTRDGYVLYIHIADVSAFVKKGGELDNEALKRGTSYYLGNSVIPMLPEALSNNLCSLREGEKRLTMSAEIMFDKNGKELEHSFHRGLIKVDKRMTYVSADKTLDEKKNKQINTVLAGMFELATLLKKNRLATGRIDLDIPDHELIYEKDNLKDIEFAKRLRSHLIVEEFMLSANEVVSRALTENKIPALFRVHENISEEKMTALRDFLGTLGLTLKKTDNIGLAIQRVIDQVKGRQYEQVVNFIILKSFMQAYYGTEPLGHFGLGFVDYTHFTSPIRRYPDLIVHRCLKNLIDRGKHVYQNPELADIGEKSSAMERIAQYAERDLFKLISCRYMEDKIGREFDAVISGIGKAGFFVAIVEKPIEGMVPLRFLTDDYYLIKEDEYTVVGRRLGKRFRMGDKIRVRLKEVSYESMRVDFDVV